MSHSHNYTAKVTKLPRSMAEVFVVVPFETLDDHREFAIEAIGGSIEIPGFRKGKIPEKVLVGRVGEMAILSETADIVIRHLYPHILEDEKLDPIGVPEVKITKLAPGNPLEFSASLALVPTVALPDYRAIAKKENEKRKSVAVTDADVGEAIEKIQRQKLAYERIRTKATEGGTPEERDEDFSKLPLPELTDEYVKGLGNFETVEQFKTEIRSHLQSEKESEATSKQRAAITDAIIEKTAIDLPQIVIDAELGQMFAEMEADSTRAGLKFDDYLSHVKKTREDLKREWTNVAEKRAKLQLILNEIAKKEGVEADSAHIETETRRFLEHFKDADERRVRIYVESTLRNDAVLSLLEKQEK